MKLGLIELIKRLALLVLPQPILYRLWHLNRKRRPRTELDSAMDHRVINVQTGVRLNVYWADVPNVGRGPGASLFVLLEEVMRIDCFGGNAGHMHINPVQQALLAGWDTTPRVYFPPGTRESHIDRAAFELTRNTPAALQTNQLARIRSVPIEKKNLTDAALEMKAYMNELLARHGGAAETTTPQA